MTDQEKELVLAAKNLLAAQTEIENLRQATWTSEQSLAKAREQAAAILNDLGEHHIIVGDCLLLTDDEFDARFTECKQVRFINPSKID
jgi:hypothetical protein